jgi:hypothetical protein
MALQNLNKQTFETKVKLGLAKTFPAHFHESFFYFYSPFPQSADEGRFSFKDGE